MRDDGTGCDAAEQTEETSEEETIAAVETKRALAGAFGRAAPTYDRVGPAFFAYFGRRLAEVAALRWGERVLDVATGLGAALFPTADAIGPSGSVVGVDLAEPMVQELTAEIRRRGLEHLARSSGRHGLCRDLRYACLVDRPERARGASGG
jgi:SAM-dependent methyltransferase